MPSVIDHIGFNIYYYTFVTVFKCNIYISIIFVEKELTFDKLYL